MKKSDWIRLQPIQQAADELVDITKNRSREDLNTDRFFMFTVIKLVEIMGETASKISNEITDQYPQVPWQQMIRIRNRLIHGYFDINLNIIWKTSTVNIPPVSKEIANILANDTSHNDENI
ncbi:MAG: HepT-like ribonuclease domain-containing protein [Candidatus Omnitrophota bacterium]